MKNKPINVGVIGCGFIMRSMYVPTLLSVTDSIRVAAVCDLNEEAARACAAHFAGAAVFTDVAALLRKANLDAVMVLTTEKVNAAMAQRVLQAGLPVYLEKPPAVSSPQLEELIAAEAESRTFVYTAFNRRHTPLYAGLDFAGEKILRVSGALRRTDRVVATFPHTSIHLVDSSQHFARSRFQSWEIDFKEQPAIWTVSGKMEGGADFSLEFIPAGTEFAEYLILETAARKYELQFPNTAAVVAEGELIVTATDGSPEKRTWGKKEMPGIESMGFRPCLLDFVEQVSKREPSRIHRLSSCRATIRVIEEMEALVL